MPDQNRNHDYDTEKAVVEGRRQERIRLALATQAEHFQLALEREPAERLDAELARIQGELARAVQHAEDAFRADLRALGSRHHVSNGHHHEPQPPSPQPTNSQHPIRAPQPEGR